MVLIGLVVVFALLGGVGGQLGFVGRFVLTS